MMIKMLINVTFLGLILIPVFILFVAFYQNLLEIPRSGQRIKQRRVKEQSYYTGSEEVLSARLKVVK